jgi:hypothetical protein
MGRRNWCHAEVDKTTGDCIFDIRVEKEKGSGVTLGSVRFSIGSFIALLSKLVFQVSHPCPATKMGVE